MRKTAALPRIAVSSSARSRIDPIVPPRRGASISTGETTNTSRPNAAGGAWK
jgi:hypothetical protein